MTTVLASIPAGTGTLAKQIFLSSFANVYPLTPAQVAALPSLTGVTDSLNGVQAAVSTANIVGVTLIWDCDVYCSQGFDYSKSVIVPSYTNIVALPSGSLICDGIGVSILVLQNAMYSTFNGLNLVYIGNFGALAISGTTSGSVATFGTITGGSGYTNGTWNNCRLTSLTGGDCYAQITVSGGAVTAVSLMPGGIWGGGNFSAGQSATCTNIYLGGAGSGFAVNIGTVTQYANAASLASATTNSINTTYKNYLTSTYVAGISGNQYINGATPFSGGANNQTALVQIRGASSYINFNNCTWSVPANAPASSFIPMCASIVQDLNPGTITSGSGTTAAITAIGTVTNAGTGYIAGFWPNCPVTGGSGTQATVDVTVSGAIPGVSTGSVTSVVINQCGANFVASDTGLSVSNAYLGGSGSGLAFNVSTVGATLKNPNNFATPTNITFNNCILDGYIMGFVGASQGLRVNGGQGFRYCDLQNTTANDPLSLQIGGVNTWFPPPHFLYVNSFSTLTSNISQHLDNCIDWGTRVGTSVVRSTGSGIANSFKMPIQNGSSVKNCRSFRVEGALQMFSFGNPSGDISGFYSRVNSASLINVKPGDQIGVGTGWIFPGSTAISNVFFEGKVEDTATIPAGFPIGSDSTSAHTNNTFNWDIVTPDWPQTNATNVNSIGQTISNNYAAGYPGVGIGGTANVIDMRVKFSAMTNTSQTFRGVWANQGAVAANNCDITIKIAGWRNWTSGGVVDANRPRILLAGANAVNNTNRFYCDDISNQCITEIDGAMRTETITIDTNVTPTAGAGAYTVSAISMPNTGAICLQGIWPVTSAVGANTFNIGDSGSATRFATGIAMTAANAYTPPLPTPIILAVSPTVIVLTPVGGSWTGSGNIYLAFKFQRANLTE